VYVVDLAWLRTTPWRERLAAAFDPADRRPALSRLTDVQIRHHADSRASAELLVGWLCSRLNWNGSRPQIGLDPVEQEAPGLAGVKVAWEGGCSLSLDRDHGGLSARERAPNGDERLWKVLGASRGEGGILGEGVRQALPARPDLRPGAVRRPEVCR